MAVTALWRVKGWLGKSLIYITNPDKTNNPEFYHTYGISTSGKESLKDVIVYAMNENKTKATESLKEPLEQYITGINCSPDLARTQMQEVKKFFHKEDGTVAYHGYQSFAPGEVTAEQAHEIGVELARQLWGERYQVIVATHLDTPTHIHNHFVLNTVSFKDGKKYHRSKQDYQEMKILSDTLCAQCNLSVIKKPSPQRSKTHAEIQAERQQMPTWRKLIQDDLDEAIKNAMTERQFFENLQKMGYDWKIGKDISVKPPNKERYVRLIRCFGPDYSLESICRKILEQQRIPKMLPVKPKSAVQCRLSGNWKKVKKTTGFRALYFHYCYLLGIFPKNKPRSRRKMHFLLREELLKMERISCEARLLAVERIDTVEQLEKFQESLSNEIDNLMSKRKELRKLQRTVSGKENPERLKQTRESISELSTQIYSKRRDMALCEDIAQRSKLIQKNISTIRKSEGAKEKERTKNELFRRRSGANR